MQDPVISQFNRIRKHTMKIQSNTILNMFFSWNLNVCTGVYVRREYIQSMCRESRSGQNGRIGNGWLMRTCLTTVAWTPAAALHRARASCLSFTPLDPVLTPVRPVQVLERDCRDLGICCCPLCYIVQDYWSQENHSIMSVCLVQRQQNSLLAGRLPRSSSSCLPIQTVGLFAALKFSL